LKTTKGIRGAASLLLLVVLISFGNLPTATADDGEIWTARTTPVVSFGSVTNKALTANVATLTTSAAHTIGVAMTVEVTGVDATFNGTYIVTSVPTSTTFTYAKTASNVASTVVSPAGTVSGTNSWRGVTYANGLFVAVADTGIGNRVMTSSDGINWTSRTSAADNGWRAITYGKGLFVAVGDNGSVMTSPDGITWTSRTSANTNQWLGVAYADGLFVAVAGSGTNNRVMTSPDGITWTLQISAADNQWRGVTYGNGLWVVISQTGTGNDRVMTSPNGINWTIRTAASDNNWRSVTYANGLFVAVAFTGTGNRVMTSPDGITWTSRNSAADNEWRGVTYGNGLFVAVADSGIGNRVMTSPDGITWTIGTSAADNGWLTPTYGNGLFVAVAGPGSPAEPSVGFNNRVMTLPSTIFSPMFSSVSSYDRRSTVQVTNYDAAFTYTASSSTGQASINSTGLVTVIGLNPGQSATVTVTTTRAGYETGTASVSASATAAVVASLTSLTFTDDGSGTAGKLAWVGKNIDAVLFTGPEIAYPGPFNYGAFTSGWNGRIRNLTPDTSYTVSIFAVSADGVGESKSLTFKTGAKNDLVKNLAYWNTWLTDNTYSTGEAARLFGLLTKFNSLETSPIRSFFKVPISRASTVTATSQTPKSCSVVSTTAKVDAGLVKALTKDTCTISYTVSGPSKAPATLVKDFVFKKIA